MDTPTKVNVTVINPKGYEYSLAFKEVAESLFVAFSELGFACEITVNKFDPQGINIVLGGNLILDAQLEDVPQDAIIYNLEQLSENSPWLTPAYLHLLTTRQVWDYSQENIDFLCNNNSPGKAPLLLPVGYVPQLTRIPKLGIQDIDILFYGAINDRRQQILEQLSDKGLNVVALTKAFGDERDAVIARSKVVLSVHFYPNRIFDTVRITYLMANSKAVVAELPASRDTTVDALAGGIALESYDSIVDACVGLVFDQDKREALELLALQTVRKHNTTQMLTELLTTHQNET